MNLTHRQLAQLRLIGRQAYELELRHAARRAARTTQVDYIRTLQRRLEQLPRDREAHLSEAPTGAQHEALRKRFDADAARVAGELDAARVELEQLQTQLAEITAASSPQRELISRILVSANLTAADAGIDFGEDSPRLQPAPERISLTGGA